MITVLVVDDEEPLRLYVARLVEDQGYRAITAADGAEALSLIDRLGHLIHVVITDVSMPNLSGPELAARLALRPDAPPILFMSGTADAKLPGPLLAKPFLPADLSQMLRRVMVAHPGPELARR